MLPPPQGQDYVCLCFLVILRSVVDLIVPRIWRHIAVIDEIEMFAPQDVEELVYPARLLHSRIRDDENLGCAELSCANACIFEAAATKDYLWDCEFVCIHAWVLRYVMLRWMRRAGCYRVYYGVESGSPAILRAINKRFTVLQVATAFDLTHNAGIEPCCFLMVGNPGETPQTISETVALMHAIRPATMPTIGITTILPGTELYDLSKGQGLLNDAYWLTDGAPPLYTGEYDVDGLIRLQMMLTQGICPELYERLCEMGFDAGYFRLREILSKNAMAT